MLYPGSILAQTPTAIIAFVLLIIIFLSYLAGAQLGNYQKKYNPEAKADGVGPLEGALLGLLALLLSFTFSMSASRFDKRNSLIVDEANNISTVVLRADMYPDSIRSLFKNDLREYIEARIAYYKAGNDKLLINKSLADATRIFNTLWQRANELSRNSTTTIPHSLMIPALNDISDVVTSRDAARVARVPDPIIWLLIILSILGSLIIGYSRKEKKSDWIVLSVYALMTVVTIYTIIDLDRPRQGMINTDTAHQKMIELRELFAK